MKKGKTKKWAKLHWSCQSYIEDKKKCTQQCDHCKENYGMLDKLNHKLKNTPKEELIETWRSGDYLDKGGLKVSDWLNSKRK